MKLHVNSCYCYSGTTRIQNKLEIFKSIANTLKKSISALEQFLPDSEIETSTASAITTTSSDGPTNDKILLMLGKVQEVLKKIVKALMNTKSRFVMCTK